MGHRLTQMMSHVRDMEVKSWSVAVRLLKVEIEEKNLGIKMYPNKLSHDRKY